MKISKVLFAVILFSVSSSFLFAQDALKKGVYNLGGSISYSNSKDTSPGTTVKQFSFSIAPELNYFVIDNLLVGGNITFQYFEYEFSSGNYIYNKDVEHIYGIGPSIRYYFAGSDIIPFIGASASYLTINNSDFEAKSFTATAGINYFLSNSVALEPFLSYTTRSISSQDETTNTFSIGVRINYFIIN